MRSLVLLLVCSLMAYSRACTVDGECEANAIICGNGWHVHCDHGLCTCAQDGQTPDCGHFLLPRRETKLDRKCDDVITVVYMLYHDRNFSEGGTFFSQQCKGCHQDSDCVDGIHVCPDSRPVWRCDIREINGVTRGTCNCQRN